MFLPLVLLAQLDPKCIFLLTNRTEPHLHPEHREESISFVSHILFYCSNMAEPDLQHAVQRSDPHGINMWTDKQGGVVFSFFFSLQSLQHPAANAAMNLSVQEFCSDQTSCGDSEKTHTHTHAQRLNTQVNRTNCGLKGIFFSWRLRIW